jgi:hypothetical protein
LGLGIRRVTLVTLSCLAILASADAQPMTRHATNLASVLAFPSFYHLRPILVVGAIGVQDGQLRVTDGASSVHLVFNGTAPDGVDEVRGEFWDLGRMKSDDTRLAAYDLRAVFHIDPEAGWPKPGEVMAIVGSSVAAAQAPTAPSIRAIVLNPVRYLDKKVTITGQFSGRNLMGDLPDAPAKSRYDFVLRSADAAIWVSNIQPKGKDNGKSFELGLDARIDTGRWIQISGTVKQGRGLQWVEADPGSFALVKPPQADAIAGARDAEIRVPAAPPPEVVFSAPTDEESGVSPTTSVRIQFSRDVDAATVKGHVHVSYVTTPKGVPKTAEFTAQYTVPSRVLELKFANPLERFSTVVVEFQEGLLGADKQPVKPWRLTFDVGAN